MGCQVFRKEDGSIDRVEASNGEESELFKTIKTIPGIDGEEDALKLWANTYTKSFKDWFGDGVTDINGEPQLLFHGTNNDFDKFKSDNGIFLTENYQAAEDIYGDNVYPLFLNASNLAEKNIEDIDDNRDSLDKSKDKEYYALNKRDSSRPIIEYVVFDSNKVKSLFNEGSFSKKDDVIYYHKSSSFETKESEYKKNIENSALNELISIGLITSKEYNGYLQVRNTIPNNQRVNFSEEEKIFNVTQNLLRINKLNNFSHYNNPRFLIDKRSPKRVVVSVNPDYIQEEWEKLVKTNNIMDREIEDGKITPSSHDPFSPKYIVPQQKETAIDLGLDTIDEVNEKISILKKSLNANVVINSDLPKNVYGRVKGNIIEINPTYVRKDTVIHEFGHLYVDLLGGMDNNFIKRGRKLLEGSKIAEEVIKNYPELSNEQLDKEIITTAIGIEGANLYDLQKTSSFQAWLKIFFNKIRLLLGLNGNVALELSQQMLNNKIKKYKLTGEVSDIYQQSKTMSNDESSSEADTHMDKLINKITDRIIILRKKYDKSKNETFKEDVAKLLKVLESHRDARGVIRYVDEVVHQTENIEKRLKKMSQSEEPVDTKVLSNIRTFMGAFDLISDVRELLRSELNKAESANDLRMIKFLNDRKTQLDLASVKLEDINSTYSLLEKKALVELMTPLSKVVENRWRKRFERDFYANNDRNKTTKEQKEEYINNKIAENNDIIKEEEKANVERVIELAPKDITSVEAWVSDARNLDDNLISTAVSLLDKADWLAMNRFISKRNEANEIWEELYNYRGKESNQKKLYEGIIEKVDGKETGFLVGKYLSSFKDAERDFYKKFQDEEKEPTKKELIDFYTKTKAKYLNPQWETLNKLEDDNPVKKMYKHLTETAAEKDSITPESYSLALNIDRNSSTGTENTLNEITYKLPAIEKNTMERLGEQGIFTATKEGIRDIFVKDTTDTEFGENSSEIIDPNFKKVIVDEQGKENQSVPIHYRGRIKKDSQQSYDLIGISLIDYNMVVNFEEKNKVAYALEVLESHASTRDVKKRKGGKFLLNKFGSSESSFVTTRGIESNSYKVLHSIIQDRLYGISSVDMGDIGGVSINKMANAVMGWTGNTMLMLNWAAGSVNILQGKYQNFLESTSSIYYDKKDLRAAELLYTKDSKDIIADIGHKIPNSKTNLLVEKFDAFADFSGIISRYSNDSKAKRLANTGTGHFINHTGEHYIQSTLMYAILNNIKVKDSEGKSIPLHEAYEKKGNELILKKGIELGEDFEFNVSRKIKEVIKQLHGNYDNNNQSMTQRYVAGKFAFMLRKWMIVGTQRRWRGLRFAFKDPKHRTEDDVAFNSILENDMEGYYTTSLRFLGEVKGELTRLKFSIISGKWNELTDLERSNIRKTVVDASTMLLTWTAGVLLAGLAEDADEEDKKLYYTAAYIFRRHYSEVAFYSNPSEGMRILQTPAATLSMIDKSFRLIYQFGSPTETYERGRHKGENKLKVKAGKLVPIVSQLDRSIQESYEWLAK